MPGEVKHLIRCIGRRRLELSRQDDDSLLVRIRLETARIGSDVLANLVLQPAEARKLRDQLAGLYQGKK